MKFEKAKIEVVNLEMTDIVVTSGNDGGSDTPVCTCDFGIPGLIM